MEFTAENIRAFREQTGLTKLAFGIQVGVTENTVYRWENETSRPNEASLPALIRYYAEFQAKRAGKGAAK